MADEPSVLIGDIVANDVSIEWYEAVAIVQEVCVRLSGTGQSAPDPTQIALHQSGAIDFRPSRDPEPAIRRLGFTLTALLQGAAPPAELRLIASEMITWSGTTGSLDEFSRRLGYFERPDRTRVLQLLYERSAAAIAAAQERLAQTASFQPPAAIAAKRSGGSQTANRAARHWYVVAAAVLIAGGAAAFVWARTQDRVSKVAPPAVLEKARQVAGSVIASGVQSGRSLLTKAGLVINPPRRSSEPPSQPEAKPRRSAVRKSEPARPAEAPASPEPPVAAVPSTVPPPESAISPALSPPPVVETPPPVAVDTNVYTSADADVVPPTLVSRQLPLPKSPPSPGRGEAADSGVIDLIVDEVGNVASVKIVSMPQQFQPRMLVSAMKAWRFQPALKDGRAVRYTVRVRVPS
jgi:periplasmic protein TonB